MQDSERNVKERLNKKQKKKKKEDIIDSKIIKCMLVSRREKFKMAAMYWEQKSSW